jgi:hypothetical protein
MLMERLGWITTTAELAELAEIPVVWNVGVFGVFGGCWWFRISVYVPLVTVAGHAEQHTSLT